MTFDQCNGNWNYMYEWRTSSDSDEWYHVTYMIKNLQIVMKYTYLQEMALSCVKKKKM